MSRHEGSRSPTFGLSYQGKTFAVPCFFLNWLWRYRYFWSKVNIWNVNCGGKSIHVRHTYGCSFESVKVFETENVSTGGELESPTFGLMPNALTYWATRARHLLSHVFEYCIWPYRYFEVKLTFEMLTVRGQQHSWSTHARAFFWKCQSFWDRKCLDLRGTRIPNLWTHAECSNLLSYQGQTFAVPCFWILDLAV